MTTVADDLRFAVRMLLKSPVFTLVALLCVTLGAGAVTTIFSGMNAVVLRPLPGASGQERLVGIDRRSPDLSEGAQASFRLYQAMRDGARSFDGIGAWSKVDLAIGVEGRGHAIYGNIASGNYFDVLGVKPALGRFFRPDEDIPGRTAPVVVVSYSFWKAHMGADPAAAGRDVTVNGQPYTVIGVAPEEFRGTFTPLKVDAWVPLSMQPQLRPGRNLTDAAWLWTFGRLKAGVSRETARHELSALFAAHAATAPEMTAFKQYTAARLTWLTGLPEDARVAFLGFAGILLAASLFVLLIASVNIASMLSARGIARRRELAVRAALGASRWRLVRQLLTEVLLLFLLGGLGAVAFSVAATSALERLPVPGDTPLMLELSPDWRVLAFALALAVLTGLVFGLVPAWRGSNIDLSVRLRGESAGAGTRRTWFGNALIVGQLALSLVLLVGAGLFLRALGLGARVDPGFVADGVSVASTNTESWGYDEARGRAFYRALAERITAVPGVESVSFAGRVPLTMSSSASTMEVDAADAGEKAGRARSEMVNVGDGYFATIGIPILQGRAFTVQDDENAARVAVVNEDLARRFWPGGTAVGRTVKFGDRRLTIVGVARNAKYVDLAERGTLVTYVPIGQQWQPNQVAFVRSARDAASMAVEIQRAVASIDPLLPPPTVVTLAQATGIVLLPQRAAAWITGALGIVGLLLATVGLYGILAHSAARRTREIGVRVALGAQRRDVLRLVLREGVWLAGLGVAAGLLMSAGATRVIASLLFAVSPLDALTFVATSALLVAVAMIACYLPARRAAATDPVVALRAD